MVKFRFAKRFALEGQGRGAVRPDQGWPGERTRLLKAAAEKGDFIDLENGL